ncbi:hypothetical protein [Methylobacterium mesophilicum]
MPTPIRLDTQRDTSHVARLARLAQALGRPPDRFFDVACAGTGNDSAQLIQMWLAIRSAEGREAVFAFVSEVLRSETRDDHGDIGV